jgi:hypothetical protein
MVEHELHLRHTANKTKLFLNSFPKFSELLSLKCFQSHFLLVHQSSKYLISAAFFDLFITRHYFAVADFEWMWFGRFFTFQIFDSPQCGRPPKLKKTSYFYLIYFTFIFPLFLQMGIMTFYIPPTHFWTTESVRFI